ncbi:hypothetical protein DNHGIG_15830 [Collibacillus ludicampi]|uniref:Uncharacterized protein n=1 Tax=Collibacillus ludicampi TaxID=2771369 RepID=A0AAV4LDX4_9BACL|nr:hypothetical protein DNHGIG_15830 [Collibacillus ludicampi]
MTYCSKIVWQAFYYGAGVTLPTSSNPGYYMPMCSPYDLLRATNVTTVYTKGNW